MEGSRGCGTEPSADEPTACAPARSFAAWSAKVASKYEQHAAAPSKSERRYERRAKEAAAGALAAMAVAEAAEAAAAAAATVEEKEAAAEEKEVAEEEEAAADAELAASIVEQGRGVAVGIAEKHVDDGAQRASRESSTRSRESSSWEIASRESSTPSSVLADGGGGGRDDGGSGSGGRDDGSGQGGGRHGKSVRRVGELAVLRSSAHRAAYSRGRKSDPGPRAIHGELPGEIRSLARLSYDPQRYDLRGAVSSLLAGIGGGIGCFDPSPAATAASDAAAGATSAVTSESTSAATSGSISATSAATSLSISAATLGSTSAARGEAPADASGSSRGTTVSELPPLERFRVPPAALRGSAGSCAEAQQQLAEALSADGRLLAAFVALVEEVVAPHLKRRLDAALRRQAEEAGGAHGAVEAAGDAVEGMGKRGSGMATATAPTAFYYQYPPTLRLQPGRSTRHVRPHCDAEYGHQPGEVNFWMPLTSLSQTRTTLWVESKPGADDASPINVDFGEIVAFHGSLCRHHVPPNTSDCTRVSLDFRIGVEGYYDPGWSMRGTLEDHNRRRVLL